MPTGARSPPPTDPPAARRRGSSSPVCSWRSSGWAGRRRSGCRPRGSATTGWVRRWRWRKASVSEVDAPRTLIVNADDLGLSPAVNAGIAAAHERGIVTSASMMVRQAAAPAAADYATAHPDLAVGLHIDLGQWDYVNGEWMVAYERCAADDEAAGEAERRAPLAAFRRLLGRAPTHLDSPQPVHMNEPVAAVTARLAAKLGVPLRARGIRYEGGFYGQTGKGE